MYSTFNIKANPDLSRNRMQDSRELLTEKGDFQRMAPLSASEYPTRPDPGPPVRGSLPQPSGEYRDPH